MKDEITKALNLLFEKLEVIVPIPTYKSHVYCVVCSFPSSVKQLGDPCNHIYISALLLCNHNWMLLSWL